MVLTKTLTPDALVTALEAGQFYSSSGVTLESIITSQSEMEVKVAPQEGVTYRIDFIGTRNGFDKTSTPATDDEAKATGLTRIYSSEVGAVLQSSAGNAATYKFSGDEIYVRALVTSSRKHPNPAEGGEFERAWVQPVATSK